MIRGSQAHVDAGLGKGADYVAEYIPMYAPCDGEGSTFQGLQGGKWYRLRRPNGDILEFAHLSSYVKLGNVKEGDLIAITGNTGQVTTGPHLHIQIFRNNKRLDPEEYFMTNFKVLVLVHSEAMTQAENIFNQISQKIREFSDNRLDIEYNLIEHSINDFVLSGEEMREKVNDFNTKDYHAVYFFYKSSQIRPWHMTVLNIEKNIMMVADPIPPELSSALFEIGHCLMVWYNHNRGSLPSLQNPDHLPGQESVVKDKVQSLMPYLSVFEKLGNGEQEMDYRLVRANKDIYRLKNGVKDLFLNGRSFEALDGRWDKVDVITQEELDAIPDGLVLIAVGNE